MSTNIRPTVSVKNPYWIDKHRYYELKHFCLQYPLWKQAYVGLNDIPTAYLISFARDSPPSDPVGKRVEERMFYSDRMKMVERTAKATDSVISDALLEAVTEGVTYEYLRVNNKLICSKDIYYEAYRRFFWLLSRERL